MADQAALEIRRIDRDRKAYHNYYCDTKWGDARGYDLVVNSGKLGIEKTVDTLVTWAACLSGAERISMKCPGCIGIRGIAVFHPLVFCGQQDTRIPARISAPPSRPARPRS